MMLVWQKAYDRFNFSYKNKYVLDTIRQIPGFSELRYNSQGGYTRQELFPSRPRARLSTPVSPSSPRRSKTKALIITVGIAAAFILIRRYIFRPREKRTDWLNTLSPTLRWMNAAGSILIAANRGTFRYLGGVGNPVGEKNYVPGLKKGLWESWEIQGHEQAVEVLTDRFGRMLDHSSPV